MKHISSNKTTPRVYHTTAACPDYPNDPEAVPERDVHRFRECSWCRKRELPDDPTVWIVPNKGSAGDVCHLDEDCIRLRDSKRSVKASRLNGHRSICRRCDPYHNIDRGPDEGTPKAMTQFLESLDGTEIPRGELAETIREEVDAE
jgi:hypothetical protein